MVIKLIETISNWSGKFFSFTVCLMMIIIGKEVISRYVFNAPSIWAPEWIPFLCGMYCIMGGAYTMADRGHVNVDLIYDKLSKKRKVIFDLITFPIGLLFFGALLYGSARYAWLSVSVFEDSGTTARTPVWIAKAMLPLGTFLMGIQWISNIVLDCQNVFLKKYVNMSPELVTLLMFGSLVIFLSMGLPIGLATGGIAAFFTIWLWGTDALFMIASRGFGWMSSESLIAIPMFVFMASMLSRAGIVDDLFDAVHLWAGPLKGGLAVVTVIVATIMAAMSGIVGATEITMGLVALPAMLKRKYDKSLALGCIAAGGSLGYLIPPSILFVLYGMATEESVGKLFMGGIIPGLMLALMYIIYIIIRSYIQPDLAPALSKKERQIPLKEKIYLLRHLGLPALLIFMVMGSIYGGVTTITEASGVGAIGAVIVALIHRRFNWVNLKESTFATIKVASMIMWLVIGSSSFISVYTALGGADFAIGLINSLPFGKWGVLIAMQLILIFLGAFIDWIGILMLTIPIFMPVIRDLGFDPIWYGVLFNMNMQISCISPPFGPALFYLKGIVPPDITIGDIYRGVWPFLLIQLLALVLCMIFPQIVMFLPDLMN